LDPNHQTKKDVEKVGGLQLERQMSVMEFTEGIFKGKDRRKPKKGIGAKLEEEGKPDKKLVRTEEGGWIYK
jgi:hypothetical protein